MKFSALESFAAAALLFLMPSCATRPKFDPQTNSGLVVGSTSMSEARRILGEPDYTQQLKNSNGQFTVLSYWYYKPAENGDIVNDTLTATFKTNILDSYCFQNATGKRVWRGVDLEKGLDQITKGSSTKTEVAKALGKPSGTEFCRSVNNNLGTSHQNGHELWYWTQSLQGSHHYRTLVIEFDEKGIVENFSETESQPNTPLNRALTK